MRMQAVQFPRRWFVFIAALMLVALSIVVSPRTEAAVSELSIYPGWQQASTADYASWAVAFELTATHTISFSYGDGAPNKQWVRGSGSYIESTGHTFPGICTTKNYTQRATASGSSAFDTSTTNVIGPPC